MIKTYEIEGKSEHLDTLEKLFSFINYCCEIGASRETRIFIDGDGDLKFNICENGKRLAHEENNNILNKSHNIIFDLNEGIKDKSKEVK